MVHRVLNAEELRRRALGRQSHGRRRVLWVWVIALAAVVVAGMHGGDRDPNQIQVLVFAGTTLLFAIGLTARHLLTRR
jgi:hypothetical protein